MKKLLLIVLLTLNISLSLAAELPAPEPLNRIVAVVNEEIITQSELDIAIEQLQQELKAQNQPLPSSAELRREALDRLIDSHLLLQMATRNNLKVEPSEVDQAIEQIAKAHNLTLDQLKEQLAVEHTTFNDFQKKVADQLIVSRVQQQMVSGKVKITEADIAALKRQITNNPADQEYHLIDFLVSLPDNPSAEETEKALATARDIQQKLINGTGLNQIEINYADLGWRNREDLPQLFVDQLNNLTLKNASPPLLAPNGYHVLKLMEKRSKGGALTDEQLRDLAWRKKFQEEVNAAVKKARSEAFVQIMPNE